MKLKNKLGLSMFLAAYAFAQQGGNFNIDKSSLDAGGGKSAGGLFVVTGTIGQADASDKLMGGNYSLTGGFWSAQFIPKPDAMFKNGFEN
jgi:hypothetical protein